MRRRDFIAGLGGAAAWPLAARAQQQRRLPVIGLLQDSDTIIPRFRDAFVQGLATAGYVEGRDVVIEFSGVPENPARLLELANDLVRRQVAVIATPGSAPATLAAKAATATIPIVFGVGADPVELGLTASLNRPGANLTGYTEMQIDVVSKRLEILHLLAPTVARYRTLIDPRNRTGEIFAMGARAAAKIIGKPIEVISVGDDAALEAVFSNLPHGRIEALLFSPGTFFFSRRNRVIELAANHGVPAAYWLRQFPEAGGLMSYGSSIEEMFRQVGAYTGRILRGAKPADLPIARATKFELVINLKAAKALGLTMTPDVLSIADEVIE